MKSQSFFKALSWLLILNLVIKPVWIFAIDRQVQNVAGHEEYGTYFSILSLSIVLLFVADGGLSNMITRYVADGRMVNTKQLLLLKLVLLFVYAMICCLAAWLSNITAWSILFHVIAIQALGSLFLFLRSLLIANQFFKTDAFFSILDKALMIFLCGLLLYGWWKPFRMETFLLLQIISIGFASMVLFILLVVNSLIYNHQKEKIGDIVKWTMPFAAIILLMGMHYRLDSFLLERMRPDGALQTGIYATAYRLLDAANMIGYLTASFLVPFAARNKTDKGLISSVATGLQHGLLFIAIIASSFVFVFPSWIQQTFYHTNEDAINTVLQLCLAVLPAYYLIHIYGSLLTAFGRLRVFISILSLSVLLNVVLNLLLIPKYGALGCCVAALASQYICAAVCCIAAGKNLLSLRFLKKWLVYVFTALGFLSLFMLLKTAIPSVWIILAVVILFSVIIAIFRMKSLKLIFQSLIQQKNA